MQQSPMTPMTAHSAEEIVKSSNHWSGILMGNEELSLSKARSRWFRANRLRCHSISPSGGRSSERDTCPIASCGFVVLLPARHKSYIDLFPQEESSKASCSHDRGSPSSCVLFGRYSAVKLPALNLAPANEGETTTATVTTTGARTDGERT